VDLVRNWEISAKKGLSLVLWLAHLVRCQCSSTSLSTSSWTLSDSRELLLPRRLGLEDSRDFLLPGALSRIGAHHATHNGWARLMLGRRGLVQAPNAPRNQSQHPQLLLWVQVPLTAPKILLFCLTSGGGTHGDVFFFLWH